MIATHEIEESGLALIGLEAFVKTAEGTASLTLLRQIDRTVDEWLASAKTFTGLAEIGTVLATMIDRRAVQTGTFIDPDDALVTELRQTGELLEQAIPKLLAFKGAIARDRRLNEDHCDLLHSAHDEFIGAAGALVEAVKNLRAAIIRHDLAAEPRAGTGGYASVDELLLALRAPPDP